MPVYQELTSVHTEMPSSLPSWCIQEKPVPVLHVSYINRMFACFGEHPIIFITQ